MAEDYYVVLHGARKNVGDFLIRERAKQLLRHVRHDRELVEVPHWEPFDNNLDLVNQAKALIIMGSPCVQEEAYPGVFPLHLDLDSIQVPIALMGVGSYLFPFNDRMVRTFTFSGGRPEEE